MTHIRLETEIFLVLRAPGMGNVDKTTQNRGGFGAGARFVLAGTFHRCETHPGVLKSALITPGINYINFSDTSGWEAVVALRTTADFWGHFLIWTNPLRSLSFLLAR